MYRTGDRVKVGKWYGTIVEVQKVQHVPTYRAEKAGRRRRQCREPYCVEYDAGGRAWVSASQLKLVTDKFTRTSEKYDRDDLKGHTLPTKVGRRFSRNHRSYNRNQKHIMRM